MISSPGNEDAERKLQLKLDNDKMMVSASTCALFRAMPASILCRRARCSADSASSERPLSSRARPTQAQLKILKEQIAEADGEIMELKQGGAPLDGYAEPARQPEAPSSPLDGDDSRGSADPARGKRFIATKKLAVRSGIEANTRKVGAIAPGELVIGLEQQISTEGALRVRCSRGWVTATSLSGVPLLRLALDGEGTPGSPRSEALTGTASSPPALALGSAVKLPAKSDLIELTRLKKPPAAVAAVCGAVRVVLEGKDTARNNGGKGWALTVSMLRNYNSTLIQMKAVDPAALSAAVGRRLAKLINDPEFDPDAIAKVCGAVVGMAKWLVGVYQLMRQPNRALNTSVGDVDAESHELSVPSATVTRKGHSVRASGSSTKTGGGVRKSPSKKFFDRLSSTSVSGRPVSARAVPSQQRPRPRSAQRPQSARAAVTRKQQSKPPVGGRKTGGAAAGVKRGGAKRLGRSNSGAAENTARVNVSMEDVMRIRDAAGFEMVDGSETIDLAQGYDEHHGMTDGDINMMHRGREDASGNGHVAEPSVSVIAGGGGGGRDGGSFGSDGGGAVSAADFLTRQAPPASQGAGLRQWYDIEIGAVQLQARKLREQLDMAEHAIALLVAARDRDTGPQQ